MENMLQKIEDAVLDRLKKAWPGVSEFDIGKDFANITKSPVVSVTIEKIDVETPEVGGMLARSSLYDMRPVLSIFTVFKAVQPNQRRKGIYPMVTAAAALLLGNNLGLDIEPLEPAGPIVEIFNTALSSGGMVAFKIDLKTSFKLDFNTDPDEMTKLLVTANNYLYRENEFEKQEVHFS